MFDVPSFGLFTVFVQWMSLTCCLIVACIWFRKGSFHQLPRWCAEGDGNFLQMIVPSHHLKEQKTLWTEIVTQNNAHQRRPNEGWRWFVGKWGSYYNLQTNRSRIYRTSSLEKAICMIGLILGWRETSQPKHLSKLHANDQKLIGIVVWLGKT